MSSLKPVTCLPFHVFSNNHVRTHSIVFVVRQFFFFVDKYIDVDRDGICFFFNVSRLSNGRAYVQPVGPSVSGR